MIKRLNNVELIHWLGALFVMTGHMYALFGLGNIFAVYNTIQRVGVLFFFVSGGYVVSGSWDNTRNIKKFFIKRFFRIIPPLVFLILVTVFLIGPAFTTLSIKDYFTNKKTYEYLLNIFLNIKYYLPGVFDNNIYPNAVNGSLWTLPIEVFMYILIPVYSWLWSKNNKFAIFIVILFCCVFLLKEAAAPDFYYVVYGTDLGSFIMVAPFYLIGMLLYKLINNDMLSIDFFRPEIALLIILFSYNFNFSSLLICDSITLLIVPYIVLSLSRIKININIERYKVTYGMYLWGFLIQQILTSFYLYFKISVGVNVVLIISIIITFLVAMISYHFIEKPILKYSKKWL